MLSYQNDKFAIDDKETFIWGGEFHYFRVPKSEWKDRLDKMKAMGFNLVSTYIPWIWHEHEKGHIDLEGKTSAERDLKAFLELVKDSGMWLLVRPGPYVMAETVNSGIPEWLINEHPEIRARKEDGTYHQSSGLVSYLHPKYLYYIEGWYKKVFSLLSAYEHENGGPIIMIQYDNEVGMFHWVSGQGDYSENTLSHFKNYIIETYQKEIFSEALLMYKDFDDYMSHYLKDDVSYQAALDINQAYEKFFRVYIKLYLEKLIDISKKYGAKSKPIVNVHGFSQTDYSKRGNKYPIGLSQLYETAKIKDVVIAGDYYIGNIVPENFFDVILANAFTKAIQPKGQPLFSAEFQGGFQNGVPRLQPTTHDLKTRLTISNGMNAINYYMLVGGENYQEIGLISRRHDWQSAIGYDGSLRRHYYVIKHIVDVVRTYGDAFISAQPKNHTTLAFDADYFMTEYQNHHNRHMINHITNARQNYLFNGIGKSLVMNNISFDSFDMISSEMIDVNKHPSLIVFALDWMSKFAQQKLVNYLKDGGKLFLFPEMPTKDLNDRECSILKDYIGVSIKSKVYGKRVNLNGHDSVNCHVAQIYDVNKGFATLDLDHDSVTGFKKTIGKGTVYMFGMAIKSDWDYIDKFSREIFDDMGIKRIVTQDEWLNVSMRTCDQGSFVFIHNFEEFEKETAILFEGKDLFDGHIFKVPFKKGLILPVDWKINQAFKIDYATCEINNIKVNDQEMILNLIPTNDIEKIKITSEMALVHNERVQIKDNTFIIKGLEPIELTFKRG